MTKKMFLIPNRPFILLLAMCFSFQLNAQISFPMQSNYKYLKGSDAQFLSESWIDADFDDSAWETSRAPFRYGDGSGGTELTDMDGNYSSIFLRSKFTAENIDSIFTVSFSVNWDDGFVILINGKESLSQQRPETLTYNALASSNHESGTVATFTVSADDIDLVEGENTIAILACNIQLSGSSDFYFDMGINAITETPPLPEFIDSVGVVFSVNSGFYNSSFNVTLSTDIPNASIVYTLDGSNPQHSVNATIISNLSSIHIDPNSTVNRGTTPAVVLRASVIKDGYMASQSSCRTYIFIEQVKVQKYPGHDWPSSSVNGQSMDYNVVTNSKYANEMEEAFTDIPTISLITDNKNLFSESTGIYVNASNQGIDWERECMVEMIDPKTNDGFIVNAGVRIRGGYSRGGWNPKHSFRLFFRSKYGDSKLYFPLFGNEGVDHFDKVDLRTAQNYSWNNDDSQRNTFIREVFTRDAQGETGQPYTRSRYYHLYLNGMYWGLYQTQERSEARWASDYLGGDTDDYDVIKVQGNGNYALIATDGNTDKWREVYNITLKGFLGNKNYFLLEGKDEKGRPLKHSEVLVDIDNLIDYMINIFYTGNFDAPVSKWFSNKHANNMYAIKNRNDKSSGFIFLVHDAEHSLMIGNEGPGIGLKENRVNIGKISSDYKMEVNYFSDFHIQWLHHKLSYNTEYKQRFCDLAWKRLQNNGVFTYDKNVERLNNRTSQINMAIIAESARWGDYNGDVKTKDNAWLPELESIKNGYFPFRHKNVLEQLKSEGLFSSVDAPAVMVNDVVTSKSEIFIDSKTKVALSNNNGDIYYTTDGNDPRLIGGGIIHMAKRANSGESVEISGSTVLKARANKAGSWSALVEIHFIAEQQDYSYFKVTELHYHPTDSIEGNDTTNGKAYEFIEFRNTGTEHAINLTGLVIDSAINYEFPKNELLAPGQFFVVAAKPKKFYSRYGMQASGNFSNSFSNSSEQILITNSKGEVVMDFTYMDETPWSNEADGKGASLTSTETRPVGDPNDYLYWMNSSVLHGTPFTYDLLATSIDENADINSKMETFNVYPNPSSDLIEIQFDSERNKEFKLRIFDLNGRSVFQKAYTSNAQISLKSLDVNYGVYILSIEKQSGLSTQKIIYSPY